MMLLGELQQTKLTIGEYHIAGARRRTEIGNAQVGYSTGRTVA